MNQQEIIRNFNDDGSICLDPSLSEEEETEIGNNPTPEEMEKRKTFSGATRRFLSKLLKSGVPYEVALDTIIKRKSARGEVFSGVSKINLEREKESSSEPGCSMRYLSDAGTAEHSSVKSHLESTIGEIREGTLLPDYPVSSLNISSEEEEIEILNNPTPEEMEKRKKFPGATRKFLSKLLKNGVPYEVALETIIKRNAARGEVSSGVSKINLERAKVSSSEPGCSKQYLCDASTGEHSTMKSHLENSIGEIREEIFRPEYPISSLNIDSNEEEIEIGNTPTPVEIEKRKRFGGATSKFLSNLLKSGMPYEVALEAVIKRSAQYQLSGATSSGGSRINLEGGKTDSEPEHTYNEEEEMEIGNNPTPEEKEKRLKFPGATRKRLSKLLKSGIPYEIALETVIKEKAQRQQRGEAFGGRRTNPEGGKTPSEPGYSKRYLSDASTEEHSAMKYRLESCTGEIREGTLRPDYPVSSLSISSEEEEIEIGNNPTPEEMKKWKTFSGATKKCLSNLLKTGMPYEVALEAVIKRSAQYQLSGATSSGGSRINLEGGKTASEPGYSKCNLSDTSTAEHTYNEEEEMEIGNNPTPEEKEKRIKFPGATRKRLSKLLKSGIPYEIALETVIKEKDQRQQRGEAFGGRKTNPEGGKTPSEPDCSKRYLSDASTEEHSAMKYRLESCTREIREGTLRPGYPGCSLSISSEEEDIEIGNNPTPEEMEKRKKFGDATKKLISKVIKSRMPYEEALENALLGEATSSGGILRPDNPVNSLNTSSEEEEMEIGNNPTPVEILKRKRFGGAIRKRLSRLLKSGMPYDEALETIIKRKAERQQGGEASLGGSQFNSEGGKRNLSDASTAEHSTKKSRRDEIIKVGILRPDYPQNCLTSEQFALLKRSILAALDAVIKDGPQLRFHSCVNRNGWVLYNCADEISAEWLEGTIKSLSPWQGAELKTVRGEDIPESQVCEVFIPDDVPGKKPSSTVVLNRLRCMNRGLLTDKWRILRRSDIGFGRILTFVIDEKSMFVLRRNDYLAFFGFGRVTFQPKEDVSSGGVKSPTS